MAKVLYDDSDLCQLYLQALEKLGKGKFAKNHNDILKRFFQDLRSELHGDFRRLQAIRLLRHPSQRGHITEWIYKLCNPSPNPTTLKLTQEFLDQREIRGERLVSYLQSQPIGPQNGSSMDVAETTVMKYELSNERYKNTDVESSGDDEIEDDVSSEDGEDNTKQVNSKELDSVVTFLTNSSSFAVLKLNVRLLINPPTSIEAALQSGNIRPLRKLLVKHFNNVATDEYSWIKDLDEAGYSRDEIADILFQDANDAPWIYFEPRRLDRPEICLSDGVHIPGCVHHCFEIPTMLKEPRMPPIYPGIKTEADEVQELCGLAGITPTSRDLKEWNGKVTFTKQNSVASISYASFAGNVDLDRLVVLHRIIFTLERFCIAAGRMQASALCCDSFTVLVHPIRLSDLETTPVSLSRIKFLSAVQLLAGLKALPSLLHITESNLANVRQTAYLILDSVLQNCSESLWCKDVDGTLHLLSLTVQFLSLGLLSYNQGHVGPVQPFFLDTAQCKLLLTGTNAESKSGWITAELTNLTCIGDMVGGSVLTFKITGGSDLQNERKFDLLATAEDLLDTWGPGGFIVHNSVSTSPCAIKVCGGIIYSPKGNNRKLHWSRAIDIEHIHSVCIDPRRKLCIGSLVEVNQNCTVNEKECWDRSACAFENLDVHDDFWKDDERQIGSQGGQYIVIQVNRIQHKIPGRTWKQCILDLDPETLVLNLNYLCGLQVSFCTGVARRVSLRELIADILPIFAKTSLQDQALWDKLASQYGLVDAFHKDNVQACLKKLGPQDCKYILSLIQKIVRSLQSTGIDPEGKFMSVAWPYGDPPFHCFRISCHDKVNSWVRVLADAEDCATFAYISTHCLVTQQVKCQGPPIAWRNTTPVLVTAILQHNETPSISLGPLDIRKAYFFKKPNLLLKVIAERQVASDDMTLLVSKSSIPARFRQRLFMWEIRKSQWNRIRESRNLLESEAVEVTVLANNERSMRSSNMNVSCSVVFR
ncbi:uncharacterized protein GIQ15_01653 [Arthroderma uncinatum]|uniref:uncharacterized protein n=1 Tax=Arthroderma uncinatum TaxID=74035 RepID=UPI00144A80F4|nr:uncharacterized protein GIQ15_01653 [Arthroderma uncinatum]KAF3492136.1 hypothetical protein GIQ15_01653 [Arthroderma uncinatum]